LSLHKQTVSGEKTAGIILAAGASVRMGSTKQLLPAGGGILIEHVLNAALESELDKVILVLGHQAEEIQSALKQILKHKKLQVTINSHYKKGISTSIRAGVSKTKAFDHAMILLGDMPYITSDLINLLLHRYLDSHLPIGAVKVGSKRSHPVIFSRDLFAELDALRGDVGAKTLFKKYSDKLCLVLPDFYYDDRDIDTTDEYREFKDRLED
jgi:molybdenum cofactor cytidylyltransferase